VDSSNYDTLLIRGARILHKLQSRNLDAFADTTDAVITNEIIKDIGENVLQKALRSSEQGRHYIALTYLSAISDYPDNIFDYETNEQNINKAIREAYKNLNVRQAYLPMIQV